MEEHRKIFTDLLHDYLDKNKTALKRSDPSKHARELNMPPYKRGATDIRTYMHNDAQTLGAVAFRGPNFRCPNFIFF